MPESLSTNHPNFYVESSYYPWVEIERNDLEKTLSVLNQLIEPLSFNCKKVVAHSKKLPFYPKAVQLVHLLNTETVPSISKYAIYNESGESCHIINWTNGPIYNANSTLPISLNRKNIKDYIRFFYSFVSGKHGHFYIIENEFDCDLVKMNKSVARVALESLAQQKHLICDIERMTLGSLLYFKGTLASVDITVDRNGFIEMDNERFISMPKKSLRVAWDNETKQ